MFKQFFINLTNVHSAICLEKLRSNKKYTKLNPITIRIYHRLFGTGK